MWQQGRQPNVSVSTAVISAGGQTVLLFGEVRQLGLRPNEVTYSPVIMAFCKCGMPERALQLFDEM